MYKKQGGFNHIIAAVIILLIMAVVVYFSWQLIHENKENGDNQTVNSQLDNECTDGLTLATDIIEFSKITSVTPPGSIIGGHWKTHAYYNFLGDSVEVMAPAKMTLKTGAKYIEGGKVQYSLNFDAPCNYSFSFDHISDPIESVKNQFPGDPQTTTQSQSVGQTLVFDVGEVFAVTDGNGVQRQFDFGVFNLLANNGLDQNPEFDEWTKTGSYKYLNAVCPFDLYDDAKRAQYYSLFKTTNDDLVPTTFCQ